MPLNPARTLKLRHFPYIVPLNPARTLKLRHFSLYLPLAVQCLLENPKYIQLYSPPRFDHLWN